MSTGAWSVVVLVAFVVLHGWGMSRPTHSPQIPFWEGTLSTLVGLLLLGGLAGGIWFLTLGTR